VVIVLPVFTTTFNNMTVILLVEKPHQCVMVSVLVSSPVDHRYEPSLVKLTTIKLFFSAPLLSMKN